MMEEKKTKMSLKLQEEKYRSLVEMTDMGYVILDRQGQVLDANQIYANLTGRERLEEVIGHSVLEWTAPYDRKRNVEEVLKCIEQGCVRNLRIDYMDQAGKITPVEIHATVLDGEESFCILSLCRDITERRCAEDLLRRSEERWRYLVDMSSAWIWETDSNMRHTYTNAFVTTCLGYQADEFLQLNTMELIHPDDRTILKELVQAAVSQKKGWLNTVLRWRHKDGSWHFIETSGAPLFDSSDTFIGLHGVDHDITVRKKAEEMRLESEARFRELFETSRDGIAITDLSGRYLVCNHALLELLGYDSIDQLQQKSREELTPPEYHAFEAEVMANQTMTRGWSDEYEKEFICITGERVPVRLRSWLRKNAEGRPLGFWVIVRDITEQKKAEKKLRESEESYRILFDQDPLPGWIYDIETFRFLLVNSAAQKYYGYTLEEFYSMTLKDIRPPEDVEKLVNFTAKISDKPAVSTFWTHLKKDGSLIDVEIHSHPIIFNGRNARRVIAKDITERRRFEEALRTSEERFQLAMQGSNDGLWDWDMSTDEVYYSPRWKSMLGYAPDELEHNFDTWTRLVHPDDKNRTLIVVRSLLEGHSDKFEVEFRMQHKDGSFRHILSRAHLCHTAKGKHNRLVGTHVDITERKKIEDARMFLAECGTKGDDFFQSLARYLAESLGMDYVCIDHLEGDLLTAKTLAVYFDGKFQDNVSYTLFDTPCGEVVGKDVCCFPEGVRHRFPKDAVLQDIKAESYSGVTLWSHTHQPIGLIAVIGRQPLEDTQLAETILKLVAIRAAAELERVIAENKLTHSRDLMQFIISHAQSAIAVHDRDMKYIYVSEQYLSQYKVKEKDVIGKHHYDVFPDLPQKWRDVHQRVLAGAVESQDEDPYVREDGSVDWTRWDCRPWYEADGSIGGLIVYTEVITERKRREEALQESERRFRALAEHAPVGIFQTNAQGDCVYVNSIWCALAGMTSEQAMGKGWAAAVHPEDRKRIFHEWKEADRARRELPQEYRYLTPLGAVNWVIGEAVALTADDGTVKGYIGSIVDITDRKRAEEAMRASAKMLQTIIDAEPECVKLLDENANMISMNRAGLAMIQADSLEQMNGQCICPIITSEYRQPFMDLTRRVFKGESGTLLFEIIGMKGRHLWLETHAVPLRNENNEIFALLGLTRDITERKRAEESLRQSEEFIRSILDTVDEGFIVVDRDYRILTANKAYCSQVGSCSEDIIGQHCYEISHKTSRPCYEEGEECATRQAFETGRPHNALHRHRDANGNILYVETKAFPLKDASGAVTSVIETINNITEKYLLEEERLKTQKLESIGRLAGGIAHDFNNLLQGVFGYISMAKLTYDRKEKSLAMLEQAEKALHMSVNLTTQLLTFSKGGKPVKKLIRLEPEVENAVKFALSGSKTDYRLDIVSELWPVEADAGQLAQVIQNMVLNADEAMAGGGTVTITVSNMDIPSKANPRLPKGGRFVRIDIQDTGIGISEQNMSKIFDPYFTTKQKGSGLGLATSYSIIKNHGGLIEVKSEQNRGTTFSIYLPASRGAEITVEPTATIPASTKKLRVLLMDDENFVRSVAQEMLKVLCHEVEYAENGERAIELFSQARDAGRPFDLVILDLTVKGGMGGEKAIAKIRDIDPNVKAVVSSGYADNPVVADYRAYGFSAVLSKPYRLDALRDCLNLFLS
jgi:two-component system, cell cycle sensor histidine kinase and response regulator CckA